MKLACAHCGKEIEKRTGEVNRAVNRGYGLYCSKKCGGLDRRIIRTDAEKKEAKKLYDTEYRRKNFARLKVEKAAWFQKTYDPVKAKATRKVNMARHSEYCRQPEYKEKKREYDIGFRAKKQYGDFADSSLLLQALEIEIASQASRYEVAIQNGTLCKSQKRRREYERLNGNKS